MTNISKQMEGTILWFDNTSGEGMVGGIDGNSYYLHWSAVQGKFKPKHGKNSWVELESGWKVTFSLYVNLYSAQVDKLTVVRKAKAPKPASMYIDRDQMKAKLTAVNASFDEIFPADPVDWDEYMTLTRTTKALTKKEEKKLADINARKAAHNKALRDWNSDKSIVIMSIYREHSTFSLLRLQDQRTKS